MKKDQVRIRKEKLRQRISELEERARLAARDQTWANSAAFRRSISRGERDQLTRAKNFEELARLTDSSLRREKVAELQSLASELPLHMGTRSLNPHPARIAMIADEFLYDSFRDTAQVTYLRPENFRQVAEESDLLLVASTWRGLDNEWVGATSSTGEVRTQVIPAFRAAGVPVAFYSKEDPPNFAVFLPLAQEADYVFTSAEEVVDKYRTECPDALAVKALTFGVNPLVHNPVGSRRHRHHEVLFAGSWLDHKYPLRKRSAHQIFDGVIEAGRDLLIMDRNHGLADPRYFYPQEFAHCIGPGVPHADLMRIQRMVDVQINLNSVANSATMFANRAVELQAMGSAVISNYSRALNNLFPNVLITESAFEVESMLDQLHGDELYRLQAQGVHRAFFEHTSHQRMAELLQTVGLPTAAAHGAALMVADEVTESVRRIAAEQTMGVDVLSTEQLRTARAAGNLEHTVVLPVREDYRYHHDYARAQVSAFAYADVDFVAKNGYEAAGRVVSKDDHEPIDHADDPFRAALWQTSTATDRWLQTGVVDGSGYGTDPFGVDTWPQGRQEQAAALQSPSWTPELTVVVPVYNNGRHLENKCFRSLQRSSIFERMEILLIDDGSTDGITPLVVQDLEHRYPHVKAHFNPTGGSGSASRPRNQGLELASAPYITYLDPDNEAVNDGYARLLDLVRASNLDFAIGDMLKFSFMGRYIANAQLLNRVLVEDPVRGGKLVPERAIVDIDFQPMSIQALVADTAWLRSTGIQQPLGALGQDSLAFQEMLHAASRIETVQYPIHVYYGAVANSMVNTVSPSFYRKYLPLETARQAWLANSGLTAEYVERRARPFFERWFLSKFNTAVSVEDRTECLSIMRDLGSRYDIELEYTDEHDPTSDVRLVQLPEAPESSTLQTDRSDTMTLEGSSQGVSQDGQSQSS